MSAGIWGRCGYSALKRALEVAAAGGHPLAVVARGCSEDVEALAKELGVEVAVRAGCRCGGCADPWALSCRTNWMYTRALKRWLIGSRAEMAMIAQPNPREVVGAEAVEAAIARVRAAREARPKVRGFTSEAERYLTKAAEAYNLAFLELERVRAVAVTIAALEGQELVTPYAAAEAAQYTPKAISEALGRI